MSYKNKKIIAFTHLLVWVVLFSIPYILSYGQSQEISRIIAHFWIPLGFYAIIFYINYFVLIDRFFFNKKMVVFIGVNLAIIALFLILKEQIENTFFQEIIRKQPNGDESNAPPFKLFIYVQMLL